MSPLLPRPVIALTPERVALRGARRGDRHPREQACREIGWAGALREMLGLVEAHAAGRACDIVLSQHFAASHLVPSPPVALKPEETRAWLLDRLSDLYPGPPHSWRLAWQPAPADEALLVAVMRQEQFDGLIECLSTGKGSRPASVRSWLASWCDRHWRPLARGEHWLVLAEPGRFTLATLSQGRFQHVQGQRCGEDGRRDIADAVQRARLLGHIPTETAGWSVAAGLAEDPLSPPYGRRMAQADSTTLAAMLGD